MVNGNLGSDGGTQAHPQEIEIAGQTLDYLVSNDGVLDQFGGDPQIVYLFVPRNIDAFDRVEFHTEGDNVSIRTPGVIGGFTLYVAIGDLPYEEVIAALADDVTTTGADLERFGQYELTVANSPCRPGVEVPDLTEAGVAIGELAAEAEGERSRTPACALQGSNTQTYMYTVEEPGGVLTASLDPDNTDFLGVVEIRTWCEQPESALTCVLGGQSATLVDAEPGTYFLVVSSAPPLGASWRGPIAFDAPNCNLAANGDLTPSGITDGCRDAFDAFGRFRLTVDGQQTQIDVAAGQRNVEVSGRQFTIISDFVGEDLWRVEVLGTGDPIELEITGNLGSDNATTYFPQTTEIDGHALSYLVSNDGGALDEPRWDPQVLYMLVPPDSAEIGDIHYVITDPEGNPVGDNLAIRTAAISPGFVFYVAVGAVPQADVAAAILADLRMDAEAEPRTGNYQLTVDWALPEVPDEPEIPEDPEQPVP